MLTFSSQIFQTCITLCLTKSMQKFVCSTTRGTKYGDQQHYKKIMMTTLCYCRVFKKNCLSIVILTIIDPYECWSWSRELGTGCKREIPILTSAFNKFKSSPQACLPSISFHFPPLGSESSYPPMKSLFDAVPKYVSSSEGYRRRGIVDVRASGLYAWIVANYR